MRFHHPVLINILWVVFYLVFAALAVWGTGVVFYCLHLGWWGLVPYLAGLAAVVKYRTNAKVLYGGFAVVVLLMVYYLWIPASNDREWQAPWSQMPQGTVEGDTLVITNVRDFRYRTEQDFDVRYVTKTLDLSKLVSMDFVVSHWDDIQVVSHTLLSFGFSDGQHIALSAETRLDVDDEQGAIAGLFKQFELLFIFATEEDIFALRTNYRHEETYLYKVQINDPARIRAILLDFVARANQLRTKPEYYNTVTNNCTTALRPSLQKGTDMPSSKLDVGSILNGYVDRTAFERGFLHHRPGEGYEELKKRSYIPHDTSKENSAHYSTEIRRLTGYAD